MSAERTPGSIDRQILVTKQDVTISLYVRTSWYAGWTVLLGQ